MKHITCLLTVSAVLVACSKAPEPAAPPPAVAKAVVHASIDWVKPDGASLDAVFARAKADNKPVFLYWGAVWCPPCNQIKATVFNRPDFIEGSKAFIPVYLDGDTPGAQKLGTQFKVRGYPTTILFKPDGTELTRLPGEVDAVQYMQVLKTGLASTLPIKETLAAALSGAGADGKPLTTDGWRLLAFYAWDTDEAQLLPKSALASTLAQLADKCPPEFDDAATRLRLRALTAAGDDKTAKVDAAAGLTHLQAVLADSARSRQNADILVNYAAELVSGVSRAATPQRAAVAGTMATALDRLSQDTSLSKADQLGAVQAKLAVAQLDLAKDSKAALPADLVAQAQAAAAKADKTATDKYERQAIIPSAAHLLSEVGQIDASDAMLQAELPKAVSPYYHMLVLSSNAKRRGDKAASLDWAEKAYAGSVGPATRLQWGSGYVLKLIEMAPQDTARIEKAASQVIGELDAAPETFYERNRRSLEKMGAQITKWSATNKQSVTANKLKTQLQGVCAKLPDADPARSACDGVFVASAKKA